MRRLLRVVTAACALVADGSAVIAARREACPPLEGAHRVIDMVSPAEPTGDCRGSEDVCPSAFLPLKRIWEELNRTFPMSHAVVNAGAGDGVSDDPLYGLLAAYPDAIQGIAVEPVDATFAALSETARALPLLEARHEAVAPSTASRALAYDASRGSLDVLKLDIDGCECHVLEELARDPGWPNPKVVHVEVTHAVPPPLSYRDMCARDAPGRSVVPYADNLDVYGCSMQAARDVLKPWGYRLLQYDFPDAVFLHEDYVAAFPCVPWLRTDDFRAAYDNGAAYARETYARFGRHQTNRSFVASLPALAATATLRPREALAALVAQARPAWRKRPLWVELAVAGTDVRATIRCDLPHKGLWLGFVPATDEEDACLTAGFDETWTGEEPAATEESAPKPEVAAAPAAPAADEPEPAAADDAAAASCPAEPRDAQLAAALCPGRKAPRVAYCIYGAARTLAKPQVHLSLARNLVEAFGGEATVLWSLALEDDGSRDRLAGARRALRPAVERYDPRNETAAATFEALSHGPFESARAAQGGCYATPHAARDARLYARLARCHDDVEAIEMNRGVDFDWVVYARPDLAFYASVRPWCLWDDRAVHAPPGPNQGLKDGPQSVSDVVDFPFFAPRQFLRRAFREPAAAWARLRPGDACCFTDKPEMFVPCHLAQERVPLARTEVPCVVVRADRWKPTQCVNWGGILAGTDAATHPAGCDACDAPFDARWRCADVIHGPKRVAILFAGAPRVLSATFDDAGFNFRLDEWLRLDGPDDRLPVDAIKSAMRNEGIYEWAAPAPPPAHNAAFAAHASLVDLFRENVYLALQRQGVEFDAFWWLHARTAADVGPLERLACPLLRPPAAAGASYECVVRVRDAGDPLLRVDAARAWPAVWSTFLDPSETRIRNFLAMLHDLVRVDEMREARERATGAAYSHVLRLRPDLAVWQPLPATLFDESPNLYVVARATYVGGNEDNFMAARADVARAAMRRAEVLQDPDAWSGWNMTRGAPVPRPPNWPRAFYSPNYDMMPNTWWPEDFVAHAIKRAGGTVAEHAGAKARVIHSSTRHAPLGAAAGPDVAVLLVGADYDVADEAVARAHFVLMRDEVADRLRAETFAVGDECGGGIVAYAREYLEAVAAGVVGAGADGCRGFPPPPWAGPAFPGMQQWFRVQCAWELMEAREAARAETYSVVVRLRPDATPYPWDAALVRAAAAARRDVVFAATDHAFWGSRPAVAVAARLWPAIGGLFAASATPNVAFSVRAFRDSLASLPAEARSHDTWTFYSKVGVLAAPGGARPSVDEARTALAALHQQGVSYVTPGDVDLDFGRLANDRWDTWPRYFAAESDFIAWLLYNNITACDLGVGTHMLFRGVAHARAPGVCRVEADAAGSA